MTPLQIGKAVIADMTAQGKDAAWACSRMIDLWKDSFPTIQYVDDADAVKQSRKVSKVVEPSAIDEIMSNITFADVWGADVGKDHVAYAGRATTKSTVESPDVKAFEIHGHIAEGLTRSQLQRTGFKEVGGMVVTLLKPMLTSLQATLRLGSHLICRGQRYRIVEVASVVKWDAINGDLYVVANAVL